MTCIRFGLRSICPHLLEKLVDFVLDSPLHRALAFFDLGDVFVHHGAEIGQSARNDLVAPLELGPDEALNVEKFSSPSIFILIHFVLVSACWLDHIYEDLGFILKPTAANHALHSGHKHELVFQ